MIRAKAALTFAVSLCLFVFAQAAAAAPPDHCSFPAGLRERLLKTYPAPRVVDMEDLSKVDRELFQKDHSDSCPGLVRVDFYGDGNPTWALVVIVADGSKKSADLVVAHKVGENWETSLLDTAKDSTPVVWREAPGDYRDVYGEKSIHAAHPVIVFAGYESWAILYAWSGKRAQKVWLAD